MNDEAIEYKSTHIPLLNKDEQSAKSSLCSDVSSKKIGVEDFLHRTSIFPEAHEIPNEPELIKLDAKVSGLKLGGELNENDATSILDKIFVNATTMNVSISDSIEVIVAPAFWLCLFMFCAALRCCFFIMKFKLFLLLHVCLVLVYECLPLGPFSSCMLLLLICFVFQNLFRRRLIFSVVKMIVEI